MPEGDDVKDMVAKIYAAMDDKFNFGSYVSDLQACW
jgi:hypothetical protein